VSDHLPVFANIHIGQGNTTKYTKTQHGTHQYIQRRFNETRQGKVYVENANEAYLFLPVVTSLYEKKSCPV